MSQETSFSAPLTCEISTLDKSMDNIPMPQMSDSKFVDYVEKKVRNTIKKYNLFTRQDKVGVAVSGGKDSTTCLHILKKLGYNIEAITIDARIGCYTEENLKNIKKFCNNFGIKLNVISFSEEFGMGLCFLQSVLKSKGYDLASCMVCGTLRRYLINKYSKVFNFDVIATGHNMDDEAQAFIMNVFRNDTKLAIRQGPISGTTNSTKFIKRVKPLYAISEKEVIRYSKIMKFPVHYGICPCSVDAYRREYKNMLNAFEQKHPNVKYNIIKFHETMTAPLKEIERKNAKNVVINTCESCGEPASKNKCKACQIFDWLKTDEAKKEMEKISQIEESITTSPISLKI